MRLGLDTEDKFLIKLNEINEQIQSTFLTEATKMTEKIPVDVMLQDGTAKKQDTCSMEMIKAFYDKIAKKLTNWTLQTTSTTNNEDLRRDFIKMHATVDDYRILLHISTQYHVLLYYKPDYQVMKKQKELADFLTMTEKNEKKLAEKSDQVILKKLKEEGYKDLNPENLFEIFYKNDKIMENITGEIDKQTDGDLNKIYEKKQKELADFLTMTEKNEKNLAEKSDQVILKKLKDEGYKDLNPENLFEIFYKDDKIMENITKEIDKQTDGNLNKIYEQKQSLLKELDNFLLEIYQIEPVLIDETRLVSGEEGFVFNLDVERVNDEQSKQFSSDKMSEQTKKNITTRIEELLNIIK